MDWLRKGQEKIVLLVLSVLTKWAFSVFLPKNYKKNKLLQKNVLADFLKSFWQLPKNIDISKNRKFKYRYRYIDILELNIDISIYIDISHSLSIEKR